MKSLIHNTCSFFIWFFLMVFFSCETKIPDPLIQQFNDPPPETKPWVYWYWIDENITAGGLTKDLEAMARVGIGEALIGHISPGTKRGEVAMLGKEWWAMVAHAVKEGQRLGVDIGFFNGPGWAQSGGPWIDHTQSMRYLTSHSVEARGPSTFRGTIDPPGQPFQDVALLAWQIPEGSSPDLEMTSEGITFQQHDSIQEYVIDKTFEEPYKATNLTLYPFEVPFEADVELLGANEKGTFETVLSFHYDRNKTDLSMGPMPYAPLVRTFAPFISHQYRIIFRVKTPHRVCGFSKVVLSNTPKVDYYAEKMLGKMHPHPLPGWDAYRWPYSHEKEETENPIQSTGVHDISSFLSVDGTLEWEVPEGKWMISRVGMLPTGMKNAPTPEQATGYENDKMDTASIRTHFDAFIGKFLKEVPVEERRSLKHVVIDSHEAGPQNWTDGLPDTFQKRYGYDPVPWLPVITGRVVDSHEKSDRFLWDWRRLVADLMARNYVGGLKKLANKEGLKLWLEPYGHWGFPAEFLQYGGQSDEVSGEFWFDNPYWDLGPIECRAASSSAHIYGKNRVFAEAFTTGWTFKDQYPANMKARGDQMFCEGINHFALHLYIHQPWDDRLPGVNAWFGTNFNRNNTWFEQGKAWIDYLRRCHLLLQQGTHAADILYFIGEDTPVMTGIKEPALPAGYDYDYINAEVILGRLGVKDHRLVLPGGKSYSLLVLPPLTTMTPELLGKIEELVRQGAHILGPPPEKSPSLSGFPACDEKIEQLSKVLWGENQETERTHGEGSVFSRLSVEEVMERIAVAPDIRADRVIHWTHRQDGTRDIYFLSNQGDKGITSDVSFRIHEKAPEFWYPDTGKTMRTGHFKVEGDRMVLPVPLDPGGSVFVIFQQGIPAVHVTGVEKEGREPINTTLSPAPFPPVQVSLPEEDKFPILSVTSPGKYKVNRNDGTSVTVEAFDIAPPLVLEGPWELSYPKNRDVPEKIALATLQSWSDFEESGMKYFSGTATYSTTFDVPEGMTDPNTALYLDLGEIHVLAEVTLNDSLLGVLWKKPFTLDITSAVKSGNNSLGIKVTNTWWNRIIGDYRYPDGFPGEEITDPTGRWKTFTTEKVSTASAESALVPSGLVGPVRIVQEKRYEVK